MTASELQRELRAPAPPVRDVQPGRRPAWPAVRAIARSELRRRWRQLLALGLLAALTGAVLLAAAQLERRSATAYPRLQERTGLDDARLSIPSGPAGAAFSQLPGVRSSWPGTITVSQLEGPAVAYVSITAGPPRPPDLLQPMVVAGRLPADDRAEEVLVDEGMAREVGVVLGSELKLAMLTADEVEQFDTGFGAPDGPRLTVRVVGLGRFPGWGTGLGNVLGTPAFAERYGRFSPGGVLLMRLDGAPDARARLEAGVAELFAARPVPRSEAMGPRTPTYSRPGDPSVLATQKLLSDSLRVFLGIAALASLLTVVQAASRHAAVTLDDQQIEAALGLTRGERRTARLLAAVPAAAVAGLGAVAGALVAAGIEPLGSLKPLEPTPGWVPNVGLLVVGGFAVAGAFLLAVALTAAPRLTRAAEGVPLAARRLPLLRHRPSGAAGGAFALSRGRSRAAVPIRTGVVGVLVGIAGLLASLVFAASATRLADSPGLFGWGHDLTVIDAKEPDVAALLADPRVQDLDLVQEGSVRIGGVDSTVLGRTPRKGSLPWSTARGRLPAGPDEVAVGPHLSRRLDVAPGDVLTVPDAVGRERRLRVVGICFVAPQSAEPLGSALVVTQQTMTELQDSPGYVSALIRAGPGAGPALVDELGARLEIGARDVPTEVRNLRDLGRLPALLGAFYAAVGAAALVHALVVTSRRRTRDLAVLQALGFTAGQVVLTLVVMATTMVTSALLVGVPLGIGVGRLVWSNAVVEIGAAGPPVVPWVQILLVAVGTWVFALAAATGVGVRARRRSPAASLRAE